MATKPPSVSNAFLLFCILPIILLAVANSIIENLPIAITGLSDDGVGVGDGTNNNDKQPDIASHYLKPGSIPNDAGSSRSRSSRNDERRRDSRASRIETESLQQAQQRAKLERDAAATRVVEETTTTNHHQSNHQSNKERSRPSSSSQSPPIKKEPQSSFDGAIARLRLEVINDPNNMYTTLALADAFRERDTVVHDGGSTHQEAISTYQAAIQLMLLQKQQTASDDDTSIITTTTKTKTPGGVDFGNLNDEVFLDPTDKSINGLLLQTYCSLGKIYFMANMFEKSVDTYDSALLIEPDYIDALVNRGGTSIILGRYKDAGSDFDRVLTIDHVGLFDHIYENAARVLIADKDALPGGWDRITKPLDHLIQKWESDLEKLEGRSSTSQASAATARTVKIKLQKFHTAYFLYHDQHTKDSSSAWEHLTASNNYKTSVMPPFNANKEKSHIQSVKQVFTKSFWPVNTGSEDETPIFIIGFPRSGSTLLERVLDAHPLIVGTGEDSVFNGRLSTIRDAVVDASMAGDTLHLRNTVQEQADDVVRITRERWEEINRTIGADDNDDDKTISNPKRFADKMLGNYMNVGFIHLLFPNALILHTSRNPMDTLYSTFKHEFPTALDGSANLDSTYDFNSLNELYRGYRDIIDHWDTVLPGRVTHVRYEDMVNDMPGVAKAVINATGLPWNPDVLKFHKKKQAVNTHSTIQVRQAVYTHSVQSWRKYEAQLQPLLQLIGPYAEHSTKTTLKGYTHPS